MPARHGRRLVATSVGTLQVDAAQQRAEDGATSGVCADVIGSTVSALTPRDGSEVVEDQRCSHNGANESSEKNVQADVQAVYRSLKREGMISLDPITVRDALLEHGYTTRQSNGVVLALIGGENESDVALSATAKLQANTDERLQDSNEFERNIGSFESRENVAAIVCGMRSHGMQASIQEKVCKAMWNLAAKDADNKTLIVKQGAIPLILAALDNHAKHSGVVAQASRALRSLAANAEELTVERLRGAMHHLLRDVDGVIESEANSPERVATCTSSLNNSAVSAVSDAPATPQMNPKKFPAALPSPWNESSTLDGQGHRGQSTHMDSIHLSDMKTNESGATFMSDKAWENQTASLQYTPHKSFDTRVGEEERKASGNIKEEQGVTASEPESSNHVERMAKRIAQVCKRGVWQAWRGDPNGLDPIYAVSQWQETQSLMIKCGLVEVLQLLLAGVSADLGTQAQQYAPDNNFRTRADGTTTLNSRFSRKHTGLAQKTLGVLINLALHKEGAECCRRAAGLRTAVDALCALPVADVARDAGRLLFLLDDDLNPKLCLAFSELLVSGVPQPCEVTCGRVYMSHAFADEDLARDITTGLRTQGIQILTRSAVGSARIAIKEAYPSQASRGGEPFSGEAKPALVDTEDTRVEVEVGGVQLPAQGPVKDMRKFGVGVNSMYRAILQANVVVVIMSKAYFESYKCRLEAAYLSNPQCHTSVVLVDVLSQEGNGGEWQSEDWMNLLKMKASSCLEGRGPASVQKAIAGIKGILHASGLSLDSEWSAIKTKRRQSSPPVQVGSDTLHMLDRIASTARGLGEGLQRSSFAHLGQSTQEIMHGLQSLHDDLEVLKSGGYDPVFDKKGAAADPDGRVCSETAQSRLSFHRDMYSDLQRTTLPARPSSAPSQRSRSTFGAQTASVSASTEVNGTMLVGHNRGIDSPMMSRFSIMRGASIGAAFHNSAERFASPMIMTKHDALQAKSFELREARAGSTRQTQLNADLLARTLRYSFSRNSEVSPSPKLTEYQASFRSRPPRPASAMSRLVPAGIARAGPGGEGAEQSGASLDRGWSKPASTASALCHQGLWGGEGAVGLVHPRQGKDLVSPGHTRSRMAGRTARRDFRHADKDSLQSHPGVPRPNTSRQSARTLLDFASHPLAGSVRACHPASFRQRRTPPPSAASRSDHHFSVNHAA